MGMASRPDPSNMFQTSSKASSQPAPLCVTPCIVVLGRCHVPKLVEVQQHSICTSAMHLKVCSCYPALSCRPSRSQYEKFGSCTTPDHNAAPNRIDFQPVLHLQSRLDVNNAQHNNKSASNKNQGCRLGTADITATCCCSDRRCPSELSIQQWDG